MSTNASSSSRESIRSYGRRQSRALRGNQKDMLDRAMERFGINPASLVDAREKQTMISIDSLFDINDNAAGNAIESTQHSQTILEVGFGDGYHLAWQAIHHPQNRFIGADPYINGVQKLATKIMHGVASFQHPKDNNRTDNTNNENNHPIENIRLWGDDVRFLMDRLEADCLDKIYMLFPDPWPKKRHHKRRLMQKGTLDSYYRLLKDGGFLLLGTDVDSYKESMIELLTKEASKWILDIAPPDQSCLHPEGAPITKYQQKALNEGRIPLFIKAIKKS